jgi:cell filamentation protein
MGELNAVHPFRDGNGRTQREFIRQPALRSRYTLDWSRVAREQVYEASQRSFQQGDNSGLEQLVRSALSLDPESDRDTRTQDDDDR